MTQVTIDPGICGFVTAVEAQADEDMLEVTIKLKSGCDGLKKMMEHLGETHEAYALCLHKGGGGPVYDAARQFCPQAACPVPAGLIKCVEVECGLALPKDASIRFN